MPYYCLLVLMALGLGSALPAIFSQAHGRAPWFRSVEIKAPIPLFTPPAGWTLGSPPDFQPVPESRPATLVIEVMLDLVCPDSARAWEVMKQLRQMYHTQDLSIVIHIYQLPYHRNSYILTQGYHLIRERYPHHLADYVDLVYQHYSELTTGATKNLSDVEVLRQISGMVASIGVSASEFESDAAKYLTQTTLRWKYAARRGVAGTPWYFVNGIDLAMDPNQTVDLTSWKRFIDSMLHQD